MHFSSENKPTQRISPYTQMAAYYDKIMIHVNYPRWAHYVETIFRQQKFDFNEKLLDIGCGTGKFLAEMEKLEYNGDGCEPSQTMRAIAKNRLPKSTIYPCGLPQLSDIPVEEYSLMVCLYDTMNYLADETAFQQSLSSIYRKLKTPGIFIFDLVSEFHCKSYFKNYIDSEVLNENVAYSLESQYDSAKKIQYTWVRVYTPEGVFEEKHCQKIFDFDQVREIIKTTDFELINVYDEFSSDKATARTGRGHFVLKKV